MRIPGWFPAFTAIALLCAPTLADADPPGVNLRWDQCLADGGVQFRDFACDTNSGSERLVASFQLPAGMADATGLEAILNLASAGAALPAWWSFKNVGTCRQNAAATQLTLPAGSVNCVDWAGGLASGGIANYLIGDQGPNHARIVMATATGPPGVPVPAGREYFAFTITISHAKTVGTGACAGCLEPVVVFLSALTVTSFTPGSSVVITQGTNGDDTRWVSWQHGHPINVVQGCERRLEDGSCFHPTVFFDVVSAVTATRNSTWGAVKSLYR